MRKRTAILASAILAVGGFGVADSLVSLTFAQNASGQSSAQHSNTANEPGASSNRDSQNEVKGVQELFARATDAAVKPSGLQQLKGMFGEKGMMHEEGGATGASGRIGGTSGGASAHSGTSGSAGSAGTAGTAGSSGTSGGAYSGRTPGQAGTASARQGGEQAEQQALNQTIQQFEQAWQQKYHGQFNIQNPALVFADIKSTDIMAGQAQPAGGELQGRGASDRTGTSSGTSGRTGTSSGTSGTPSARGGAESGMMGEMVTVNVPAVQGAQAVTIHLMREGSDNYKFAWSGHEGGEMRHEGREAGETGHARAGETGAGQTAGAGQTGAAHEGREAERGAAHEMGGMMHEGRLASALEKHLKEVVDQKDRWPSDQQQAQRLVTQHVLMAIQEVQSGGRMGEHAQPAGSRIPGESGSGLHNGSSSGTSGSGSSSSGSRSGTGAGGSR